MVHRCGVLAWKDGTLIFVCLGVVASVEMSLLMGWLCWWGNVGCVPSFEMQCAVALPLMPVAVRIGPMVYKVSLGLNY